MIWIFAGIFAYLMVWLVFAVDFKNRGIKGFRPPHTLLLMCALSPFLITAWLIYAGFFFFMWGDFPEYPLN